MRRRVVYRSDRRKSGWISRRIILSVLVLILLLPLGLYVKHTLFIPKAQAKVQNDLHFDDSVSDTEKQAIKDAVKNQIKTDYKSVNVGIQTTSALDQGKSAVVAYVPVTNLTSSRQQIAKSEFGKLDVYIPEALSAKERAAFATLLGRKAEDFKTFSSTPKDLSETAVALIPVTDLSNQVKLLTFDGAYYMDSFDKGAVFREATFSGDSSTDFATIKLNSYPTKDTTLKVNMTGVTALTRLMIKKLSSVKDPNYFSAKIGSFLADADITHTSNEVSFQKGCPYSNDVFCAPPEMIETLKSSGMDLIELTGNHNNDTGKQYNTDSINTYHSLGWHTFGGGLNTTEAAKPYIADQKNSKIAFLGYNYADSPSGGPIATDSTAGANSFDYDKIKTDIENAKKEASFVIVDVQYFECYAYPAEHSEIPLCDLPISGQQEAFQKIVDLGADMVIGTQAHQPQIYQMYKGKPIYYGIGNLYFEQIQWPGTERGIILTHYFVNGKLLQTKLSPTVYDGDFQTHLMDNTSAVSLLQRLDDARNNARL